MAAMKSFGERNGFKILETDEMPKEGRLVSQVDIQRDDGVMVTMDNFLDAGVLTTYFYAKKPDADWRQTKEALRYALVEVLQGRGEIREVPLGP